MTDMRDSLVVMNSVDSVDCSVYVNLDNTCNVT